MKNRAYLLFQMKLQFLGLIHAEGKVKLVLRMALLL